jgi:hypothetical protein
MMRLLPYLGGVLVFVVIIVLIVLAYRLATRDDRMRPKRVLQKQLLDMQRQEREVDRLLEELTKDALSSSDTEPVLAHSVLRKVNDFRGKQEQRKELYK